MSEDSEGKFVPPEALPPKTPESTEKTAADIRSSYEDEILDILSGKRDRISQEALSQLIPQRIHDIAVNPDMVEFRPLRHEPGEISILVIEKNYPNELTDVNAWTQWKKDIEAALQAQAGKPMKVTPLAPESVNRLHARFRTDIEAGNLSLKDRVLMTSMLRLHPNNQQALYVGDFDGEPHQGIGLDFYKNTLPSLAKKIGLRFIVGANHSKNFSFFYDTLGRFNINDIKPEFQNILFPNHANDQFFTIQFLYPEDVEKYVSKNKLEKKNRRRTHENRT